MNKEAALDIWDAVFGKGTLWAVDCFGTYIFRDDYADTDKKRIRPGGTGAQYNYGWEIDHIRPKASFPNEKDADLLNNFEPMHWKNNRAKGDSFPSFVLGQKTYQVVADGLCKSKGLLGYGINDSNGNRIDWKGKQGTYFLSNK